MRTAKSAIDSAHAYICWESAVPAGVCSGVILSYSRMLNFHVSGLGMLLTESAVPSVVMHSSS